MNINNLRYADDTALIADSNEKLQKSLDRVVLESEKMGLAINCTKTFSLTVSRRKCPDCKLNTKDKDIKQVDSFTYLGSIITSDGRSETDIKCRIGMVETAFTGMRNVLCSMKLNIKTRKRVLKCYVWSVLTYGSECSTISKNKAKRIEAAEMWFLRRMLRIQWVEKLSNEKDLERVRTKRGYLNNIMGRQLRFIGHVLREGGIEKRVAEGEITGKKARGRQRQKMLGNMKTILEIKTLKDLVEVAKGRERWRRLTKIE